LFLLIDRFLLSSQNVEQFDMDLYFKLLERITVHDNAKLTVGLLEGSELYKSRKRFYKEEFNFRDIKSR
jgi:hypothetical protein